MSDQSLRIELNTAVLEWAVRAAVREKRAGRPEQSARWALVAASEASAFGVDRLMDADLESLLQTLLPPLPASVPVKHESRTRWLHVMSIPYDTGGHTALVRRWITEDDSNAEHSVVFTFQNDTGTNAVVGAAKATGGTVTALGTIANLIDRARALRQLANKSADIVVLHIHMWDVVSAIAFGAPSGPPVLFLNHADHLFWVGAAAVDAVICIRQSSEDFARVYRGVQAVLRLPIPLPATPSPPAGTREVVRERHGIPPDAHVVLTIGSEFKYTPVEGLSFFDATDAILKTDSRAWILAVGPSPANAMWDAARTRNDGRVVAVGAQLDVTPYHTAADVYLEGFPFGSLTAMLEAGAAGLPIVRAPVQAIPPYVSDGDALDHLGQPASPHDCAALCVELLASPALRQTASEVLKKKIAHFHQGAGWRGRLSALQSQIPDRHDPSAPLPAICHPAVVAEHWAEFSANIEPFEPVWFSRVKAEELHLTPQSDAQIAAILRRSSTFGPLYRLQHIARLHPLLVTRLMRFADWIGANYPRVFGR